MCSQVVDAAAAAGGDGTDVGRILPSSIRLLLGADQDPAQLAAGPLFILPFLMLSFLLFLSIIVTPLIFK